MEPRGIILGASGAVMALAGAQGVIFFRAWRRGVSVARGELIALAILLAVQTLFDWVIPNVSFAGHASGVVFGALLTALLSRATPPPRRA
jgi:rhomboid protease GluP